MPIRSAPVSPPSGTSIERAALARELAATDVDLRDPAAGEAIVDLVSAVHDLLMRT